MRISHGIARPRPGGAAWLATCSLSETCNNNKQVPKVETVSVISLFSHTESWLKDQVYEFLAGINFVCHADTAFVKLVIL